MSQLLAYFQSELLEAGLDEAGRGCLAGPVVAAAVILPHDFDHPRLNDSKKLSALDRLELREEIIAHAISYGIGLASVDEIDDVNILNASFLAMHRALEQLQQKPELLLVDGNRFRNQTEIPYQCIVGGDAKYRSIAAASILAKVARDILMEQLDKEFPHYNWKQNKGYPTKAHKQAIAAHGRCIHHRRSFNAGEQLRIEI